jgi:ATP-dependent HslUV protease ATP-binding subunit HslU
MATEGLVLDFTADGIEAIADAAVKVNSTVENIGARRLQTVMEKLVEEVSFEAEDRKGSTVTIDAAYVRDKLTDLAGDADLSKYIL